MASQDALIIILPAVLDRNGENPAHLAGVDLANQHLAPSSDRHNVVELWRIRELKEFERCFASYPHPEKPA